MTNHEHCGRRDFLKTSALLLGAASANAAEPTTKPKPKPVRKPLRVAMINSIYRFRSHAYHIGRRLMHGYDIEGFHHAPNVEVVRMFNHQYPADDMSRAEGKKLGYEVVETVAEALGGTGSRGLSGLDVDAVLLVVEHGDYPTNEFNQILYPRHELFQEIVKVFESAGRGVPVFVDKHLSYDSTKARDMFEISRRLKFGLMAGSSLPVTWRRPELEPPLDTPLKEGLVAFGYDRMAPEVYFFHGLEALACMMERRRGGETGIKRVTGLEGPAVWRAGDEGLWSWDLLHAALNRNPTDNTGDVRENVTKPQAILIDYADGTRGAVLNLIEQVSEFSFAGRLEDRDEPISTWFVLPPAPGAKFFDALTWNIERFLRSGKPPYPVERTLLTSTVLDLGLRSIKHGGKPTESDLLDVRYRAPVDSGFFRGRFTHDG